MTYEDLLNEAQNCDIIVIEKNFKSDAKGLCKGRKIGIRYDLPSTEKLCILAEELGHYFTTVGNILDQRETVNQKQEQHARAWAYEKLVPIELIHFALLDGYSELYEIAEYLSVDECFLRESLDYYEAKYGPECVTVTIA